MPEEQTINEKIRDAGLRRQLRAMRYASGLSREAVKQLRSGDDDLRSILSDYFLRIDDKSISSDSVQRLLNAMDNRISVIRNAAWKGAAKKIDTELKDYTRDELDYLYALFASSIPVAIDINKPKTGEAQEEVKNTPVEGVTIAAYLLQAARRDVERVQSRARLAIVREKDPLRRVVRVMGSKNKGYRDGALFAGWNSIDTLTRTAVNHVRSVTGGMMSAANDTFLDREIFTATLDARTTSRCASLDGKVYAKGDGPKPPLHFRCRSVRLAFIGNKPLGGERPFNPIVERKVLKEYTVKNGVPAVGKRSELPYGLKTDYDKFKRTRYRQMVGRVPGKTTYNDWLKNQSTDFQNEVLGKSRAQIWRKSGEHLDKFVDRQGQWLTLADLKAKGI